MNRVRLAARTLAFLIAAFLATTLARPKEVPATIVYDDVATDVASNSTDAGQLWITTADLTRATRFELKPQGVCREQLCFPVPRARANEFVRKGSGATLFNLVAFAGLVRWSHEGRD